MCHILINFMESSRASSNGEVPTEWRRFGPRRCCISDFGDWVVSLIFKFILIHSVEFKSNLQQSLNALYQKLNFRARNNDFKRKLSVEMLYFIAKSCSKYICFSDFDFDSRKKGKVKSPSSRFHTTHESEERL